MRSRGRRYGASTVVATLAVAGLLIPSAQMTAWAEDPYEGMTPEQSAAMAAAMRAASQAASQAANRRAAETRARNAADLATCANRINTTTGPIMWQGESSGIGGLDVIEDSSASTTTYYEGSAGGVTGYVATGAISASNGRCTISGELRNITIGGSTFGSPVIPRRSGYGCMTAATGSVSAGRCPGT